MIWKNSQNCNKKPLIRKERLEEKLGKPDVHYDLEKVFEHVI